MSSPEKLEEYIPTFYNIIIILEELYVCGYVNYKPSYNLYLPDESSL